MTVFVDASWWIALVDPTDQWHAAAKLLLPKVRGKELHTHVLGLAEVLACVGSARGGKAARDVYRKIGDTATIHYPDSYDVDSAMDWVLRSDGTLSLSDSLAIQMMQAKGIHDILSFDSGFDGKGIRRLA